MALTLAATITVLSYIKPVFGIIEKEYVFTIILILGVFSLTLYTKRAITKFGFIRKIEVNRRKIIFKLLHIAVYVLTAILLAIIWGVDLKQFSVFISSVLAVLGVGFFAQWSLLSNLTASVILFFNHPVRLGNRIRILDKEFDWTGVVEDITGFYLFLKTDDGRSITLPNSLVLQKGIEILDKKESIDPSSESL